MLGAIIAFFEDLFAPKQPEIETVYEAQQRRKRMEQDHVVNYGMELDDA